MNADSWALRLLRMEQPNEIHSPVHEALDASKHSNMSRSTLWNILTSKPAKYSYALYGMLHAMEIHTENKQLCD